MGEQEKVLAGLARDDPFTVVSEQFVTDTARYADLLLPATTQLEQDDIMFSWGNLGLSLNQKAIGPLGEAVPNTELFRRLARATGFDDRQWQRSDEAMILDGLGPLATPAATSRDDKTCALFLNGSQGLVRDQAVHSCRAIGVASGDAKGTIPGVLDR